MWKYLLLRNVFPCAIFALASIVPVFGAECLPSPALQTQLQAHPNSASYESAALWFGEHKQLSCAAEAYRKAFELSPKSPRLAYMLGLNLFSDGKAASAVLPLRQSIELSPAVLKPHLVLAEALDQLGRSEEASAEWQAALKLGPTSPEALHGVAKGFLKQREYSQVIGLLRSTPDDDVLIADIAQSYMGLHMSEESFTVLRSALKRRPTSIILANSLARMHLQKNQYLAAEKLCAETLKQHPTNLEAKILYLQTLLLTGNKPVARPLAKKLLTPAPSDFTVLVSNGVLEHYAGEFEAAREHFQKAIAINPNLDVAHFNLGLTLVQLGDNQGAKKEFESALELGATGPEVHLQFARVLRSLGENDASATQLTQYRQSLEDQHDRALALSKTAQGDKALEAGQAKEAAGFYREALNATPNDAELNFKMAVALDRVGDTVNERTLLEKAVELNPDLAPAENQLGFLASQSGDPITAEKHFRQALRAAPTFTEAWVNLAASLGLQSKFSEAEDAAENALRLEPKNPQALLLRETIAKALAQH